MPSLQSKTHPEIGMPTANDPNQKMSAFAVIKEKQD
jgi:hypothetical protein